MLHKAEEIFRQRLREAPDDPWWSTELAMFLARRGTQLDEALSLAKRALEADPNSIFLLSTLGYTYYKRNEFAEAEAVLRKAIEKGKDQYAPVWIREIWWGTLGNIYERSGDVEAAKEAYREVLKVQPFNKEAKWALERLEKK